jgi:predicted nucleic acid-binding protein
MLTGVDTSFFFALEEANELASEIWQERDIVVSAITIYELQKKLLAGNLQYPAIIEDIKKSSAIIPITEEVASRAGHIAHGTGMPGLDALIVSSFLQAGCEEIYTTDAHLGLYKKKGVKVIYLNK